MSAFNDTTCPKCKRRFGWQGDLTDCPPCPGCGHQIPKSEMEADEKIMKEFEEYLLARKNTKKGRDV